MKKKKESETIKDKEIGNIGSVFWKGIQDMRDETSLASGVIEKIPNKYMAVIVCSRRARALNDGARPLVKIGATKPTTVAMEEIAEGVVVPGVGRPEIEATDEGQELLPSPSDTEGKLEVILEVENAAEDEDESEEDESEDDEEEEDE